MSSLILVPIWLGIFDLLKVVLVLLLACWNLLPGFVVGAGFARGLGDRNRLNDFIFIETTQLDVLVLRYQVLIQLLVCLNIFPKELSILFEMLEFLVDAGPETLAQILLAECLLRSTGLIAFAAKNDFLNLYSIFLFDVLEAESSLKISNRSILVIYSIDEELCIAKAAGVDALTVMVLGRGALALLNGRGHRHRIALPALHFAAQPVQLCGRSGISHELGEVPLVTGLRLRHQVLLAFDHRQIGELLVQNLCEAHRRHHLAFNLLILLRFFPRIVLILRSF